MNPNADALAFLARPYSPGIDTKWALLRRYRHRSQSRGLLALSLQLACFVAFSCLLCRSLLLDRLLSLPYLSLPLTLPLSPSPLLTSMIFCGTVFPTHAKYLSLHSLSMNFFVECTSFFGSTISRRSNIHVDKNQNQKRKKRKEKKKQLPLSGYSSL